MYKGRLKKQSRGVVEYKDRYGPKIQRTRRDGGRGTGLQLERGSTEFNAVLTIRWCLDVICQCQEDRTFEDVLGRHCARRVPGAILS
jgi:hypothetical protein